MPPHVVCPWCGESIPIPPNRASAIVEFACSECFNPVEANRYKKTAIKIEENLELP